MGWPQAAGKYASEEPSCSLVAGSYGFYFLLFGRIQPTTHDTTRKHIAHELQREMNIAMIGFEPLFVQRIF
jgi:hypothetical protein